MNAAPPEVEPPHEVLPQPPPHAHDNNSHHHLHTQQQPAALTELDMKPAASDVDDAVMAAAESLAHHHQPPPHNPTEDDVLHTAAAAAALEDGAQQQQENNPRPVKRRRIKRSAQPPWNDMLFDLLVYRANHSNCMVPFKSGGELGKWVSQQRTQYQNMNKLKMEQGEAGAHHWEEQVRHTEKLNAQRMRVLSSIGFVWDVVAADNDARWKKRYNELLEYKALHGHCNVPQSTDLGKWVKMQRENKHEADLKKAGTTPHRKKPKPCLSQDRIDKLEAIGFMWRVAKPAVGWDRRFAQLVEYKHTHGDCNVPQSYPPDKPFGRWVMKQRCQHSLKLRGERSQLTDEREKKLNAIGFSWVAPGFSKKTVVLPGDEEEAHVVHDQAVHVAAQQEAAAVHAAAAAAEQHHHPEVPDDVYPTPWGV